MKRDQQFRTVIDPAWGSDPASRLRWERTLAFVKDSITAPLPAVAGLDIGDRTSMTAMLESHFGCCFSNTSVDLDTDAIDADIAVAGKCYDVVTAFEVIEHLYNPLHLLLEIKKVLEPGPSSRLFLSTPVWKPGFLQSPEHFHEMSKRSLNALLKRAGFGVLRGDTFGIRTPFFCMKGVRPLLRCAFEKIRILELGMY
jgi:SAM-dependent methyltransferase